MTDRQHKLIMSLYKRCDEINDELNHSDYTDCKYQQLQGAHSELLRLADRLRMQFKAEADALREVHSYISDQVNINA